MGAVGQRLDGRGHRTFAIDLPTDEPGLLADDYAGIAAAQVGPDAREPVVVAHSGAGLLLPAVADAVPARHLVWLAAARSDAAAGLAAQGRT